VKELRLHYSVVVIAVLALAASAIPGSAQTSKPTLISLISPSGDQPYNMVCTITGAQVSGVAGPTGTVTFTDTTVNQTVATASLGTSTDIPFAPPMLEGGVDSYTFSVAPFGSQGFDGLASAGQGQVYVNLGNGNGTFQNTEQFRITGLDGYVTGDFNGDGITDLMLLSGTTLQLMLGNPDGTFQAATTVATLSFTPVTALAGDFNGDGSLDLAVTNSSGIVVLLNNGSGQFTQQVATASTVPGTSLSLQTGDFRGNGTLDLVGWNSTIMWIMLGNGDGTFQMPQTITSSVNMADLITGHFTASGNLDLAMSTVSSGTPTTYTIDVLPGNGDGTFATPIVTTVPAAGALAAGDFNADGKLDLATPGPNPNNPEIPGGMQVLYGNGDGTFQVPLLVDSISGGYYPYAVAVGQFDGGASDDIVGLEQTYFPQVYPDYEMILTDRVSASASVSNVTLPSGIAPVHYVDCSYAGDANYGASVSSVVPFNVPAAVKTTTALQVSNLTPTANEEITLTATVTGMSPTGSVTFAANGGNLATVPLNNGTASMVTSLATDGSYAITAAYSGDSINLPSTSAATTVTVAAPGFAVTASPTTQTISPGQSATFTFTVTPAGGYTGTVNFSCGTLPSQATCAFSQSSVAITGTSAASTTLTIATTAATTSSNTAPASPFGPWPARALAFAGILGLGLAPRRMRRMHRRFRILAGVLLLAALAMPLVSCAGGGGGGPKNPGTPAGSYSLSISVADSAGGPSNTAQITLVVR
jgi:hypothetical protein